MRTNPSDELKAHLAAAENIEASLAGEEKLLRDSADEQHALQHTIELSDSGQLQRMTALLTIAQVGQARRTHRHHEMETARKALVDASAHFVKTALAPRLQQLESRAFAKVEGKLKPHFADADSLRSAAHSSRELSELTAIKNEAILRSYGTDDAIREARRLLKAWNDADAFEQKHLS
jgi:hypothetical protein